MNHCTALRRWRLPLLLGLLMVGLSGCGQKGPLYLPDQPDTEQAS